MDQGLKDIPQSRWGSGTGRQVMLKGDFSKIESAILQSFGLQVPVTVELVDATSVKVPANPDSIAALMLNGFPSILHRGSFISGDLTDGCYRENTVDTTLDFDLSGAIWGTEKAAQWYVIYALAGNAATSFTLKGMPYMRFSSQASQVITLRNHLNSANIGYGFTANELAGGKIYVLTGASKGLMREITANNNDNGTGGAITYSGTGLTLTQGDWFIILPPGTNFRRLADIWNNAAGNVEQIDDLLYGRFPYCKRAAYSDYWTCPLAFNGAIYVTGCGGGQTGAPGQTGQGSFFYLRKMVIPTPGTVYTYIVGDKGGYPGGGGANSVIGSLVVLPGGAGIGSSPTSSWPVSGTTLYGEGGQIDSYGHAGAMDIEAS